METNAPNLVFWDLQRPEVHGLEVWFQVAIHASGDRAIASVVEAHTALFLGPKKRIPVMAAVRAYPLDAANASIENSIKGSISAGKVADFVVLSDNPFDVPAIKIYDVGIEKAILGVISVFDAAADDVNYG